MKIKHVAKPARATAGDMSAENANTSSFINKKGEQNQKNVMSTQILKKLVIYLPQLTGLFFFPFIISLRLRLVCLNGMGMEEKIIKEMVILNGHSMSLFGAIEERNGKLGICYGN